MSDLSFTTRGQAEALAAQELIRKKALETRREFEEGAKATQSWDASLAKLRGQGESALRSIQTEQGKIKQQIKNIEAAAAQGLIPPEEAAEGIGRLKTKLGELDNEFGAFGDRAYATIKKAFDPIRVLKVGVGFVGVAAAIKALKAEFDAVQFRTDTGETALEKTAMAAEKKLRAAFGDAAVDGGLGDAAIGHGLSPQEALDYLVYSAKKRFSSVVETTQSELGRVHGRQFLTTEELKKIRDTQVQSGDSATAVALGALIEKALGGGSVSYQDVADRFRAGAEELREPKVYSSRAGVAVRVEPTAADDKSARELEKVAKAAEETNRLLTQIAGAQPDAGGP